MGDTLYIDVRGGRGSQDDHSKMLRLQGPLDALCARLGVARLSEFCDHSTTIEELEDALGEDGAAAALAARPDLLTEHWYDPGPALEAARAVLARLEEDFGALGFHPDPSRAHWPADLLDELRDCVATLEDAAAGGWPFRFRLVA